MKMSNGKTEDGFPENMPKDEQRLTRRVHPKEVARGEGGKLPLKDGLCMLQRIYRKWKRRPKTNAKICFIFKPSNPTYCHGD